MIAFYIYNYFYYHFFFSRGGKEYYVYIYLQIIIYHKGIKICHGVDY